MTKQTIVLKQLSSDHEYGTYIQTDGAGLGEKPDEHSTTLCLPIFKFFRVVNRDNTYEINNLKAKFFWKIY